MNARQKASRGSQMKSKKYVKNKLMIGDSRPQMGVKPENRLAGSQKVTRSSQGIDNIYANQSNKSVKQVGGGKFKKEVRARSPRAAKVYGNTRKAMKASYEKPTNKPVTPKAEPKSQTGGLIKKAKAKLGTMANPIIGAPGRPRNKGLI